MRDGDERDALERVCRKCGERISDSSDTVRAMAAHTLVHRPGGGPDLVVCRSETPCDNLAAAAQEALPYRGPFTRKLGRKFARRHSAHARPTSDVRPRPAAMPTLLLVFYPG